MKLLRATGYSLVLGVITATAAFAQGGGDGAGPVEFSGLLGPALTLLLPLGLILLVSSAMPEKQAPSTAINLLLTWSTAGLAYFGLGFAFHFGGIAQVTPAPDLRGLYWEWYPLDQSVDIQVARLWGIVALRGFALAGEAGTPGVFQLFLSHLALVGVTAMIPVGALPGQNRGGMALGTGLLTGSLIYPLIGNWVWGGGWLAHLGANLGLGHGLVDFGGAGTVFLAGSMVALAGLLFFRAASSPSSATLLAFTLMPPAHLPLLGLLGAGLMLLGWFGLTTGLHVPTALNFNPTHAATAGLLAALSAGLTAAGYSWFTTRAFDSLMTARGLVAGLMIALAGGPFMPLWVVVVGGLVMGGVLPPLIYLFNQGLRLTDELGIVATYGVSALVGLLLLPFFADGQTGQGWNGIGLDEYYGVAGQGISGLLVGTGFVSDWPGQLQAQLVGIAAVMVWALLWGFFLFKTGTVVAESWASTGLELVEPAPRSSPQEGRVESPEIVTEEV